DLTGCLQPRWEIDLDTRAGGVGGDRDPGVVEVGDPARDRKTKPGALCLAARAVTPIEALENPGQFLGGNANAAVGHNHGALAVASCNVEPYAPTLRGVLDRVVQHDEQQPLDELRVAKNPCLFKRSYDQRHSLALSERAGGCDRVRSDVGQIE